MKTIMTSLALIGALALSTLLPHTAHAEDSKTVTFLVQGMVTKNCPVLVRAAVSKMKGVKSVDASLATKSATVEYFASATSPQQIQKVIKDRVGFDTQIKRD